MVRNEIENLTFRYKFLSRVSPMLKEKIDDYDYYMKNKFNGK